MPCCYNAACSCASEHAQLQLTLFVALQVVKDSEVSTADAFKLDAEQVGHTLQLWSQRHTQQWI
jgi:hypothetical protein